MRENKLTIFINRPVKEVFEYSLESNNVPKWITSIKEEIPEERPVKLGTQLRNIGINSKEWNKYKMIELNPPKTFTLKRLNGDYFVKYVGDVENKINYVKMYVGNQKKISYNEMSKEEIRKDRIDSILLEVKMRVYEFLKQYINLPKLNNYAPICLDEYITNYRKEDDDYFLRSYDFYSFVFDKKYEQLPIIINTQEDQIFDNVDFNFECGYEKDINRSARILIHYTNTEKDNFFEYPDFIPIYINIMCFYFNIEFKETLTKKRDIFNSILKK